MARIVMIMRPDRGGVFNHVIQLCEALDRDGHEAFVCGPLDHRRSEVPANVIPLAIGRSISPPADLRAAGRFARITRRLAPDLIHGHGSKGGVIARLAKISSPHTPVVITPHLYAFDNYFARPAERSAYKMVERSLARLATRVIAVCDRERQLAAEIGPPDRIRVVYNGTDPVPESTPHRRVSDLRRSGAGPIVCTVAELRRSKGVTTLVEAIALARETIPDTALVVAGDGSERESIRQRAAGLRIGSAVCLLGATDGPASVLAGADLFVNAAYAESFPYTVLEAMSAGVPIIATDVGGTTEAIDDRKSGLIVEPGDPVALAGLIVEVLRDDRLARRLGDNARARFDADFTTERMIDGIFDVYGELGVMSRRDDALTARTHGASEPGPETPA